MRPASKCGPPQFKPALGYKGLQRWEADACCDSHQLTLSVRSSDVTRALGLTQEQDLQ